MYRDESIKKIDLCEECFEKKAEFLHQIFIKEVFFTKIRIKLLCTKCSKDFEFQEVRKL